MSNSDVCRNPRSPECVMRRLQLMAIAAGTILVASIIGLILLTKGPSGLVEGTTQEFVFGIGYWLAAGTVAAAILGRMNAAVAINNSSSGTARNGLDQVIITLSCTEVRRDFVVQNQIANLFSGVLGLAAVFVVTQVLATATGIQMLANFPQGILYLFPLIAMWKGLEGTFTRFFLRGR